MKLSVITLIIVAAVNIVDSRDCPSGWKLVEKEENVECWKLIEATTDITKHVDAEQECTKINAIGGIVDNSYERAIFQDMATRKDGQICYTVVQEMDGDGNYLSIDQPPTPLFIQQLNSNSELTLRNELIDKDKIFITFVPVPKQNQDSITVAGGKSKFEPCEVSLGSKKDDWKIRIVVETENEAKMMIETMDEMGGKSEKIHEITYPTEGCCTPWVLVFKFVTDKVVISYRFTDLKHITDVPLQVQLKSIDTIYSKNAYFLSAEHVRSGTKLKGYSTKTAPDLTPNMIPKGSRSIFQRHLDVYKFGNISIDIPKNMLTPGVDLLIQQEIDTTNTTAENDQNFSSCLDFKRGNDSINLFCMDARNHEDPHVRVWSGLVGDSTTISEDKSDNWRSEAFLESNVIRFRTTVGKGEQHNIKITQSYEENEKTVKESVKVGMFDTFKLSSNVWYRNLIVTVTNEQLVTTCNYRSFDVSHYSNKLEVTHVHMPSLVLCQRSIDDFGHGEQGGGKGTKKEKIIKKFEPPKKPKTRIEDVWAYRLLLCLVLPSSIFAILAILVIIFNGCFH